ncbi:FtsH protease activity modulator HflK [Sinirhodobacter populi]|uniref:Protein HflK n=1 Tax=Paenirhodobacter populi TaxID=2306993 RepID=A0A443K8W6_9RHOB|nr:FtsH protease activity modulator HflK [Sinirhodobacter populi]RWR13252.1 FtsH protease activity modulator HflK [Sinirhodobacter populi]RWR29214.1 FtsH protease activity modulator HflK [Sinirhodobacter populi]RWR30588.1 FtsH protease activity modulator HflK [Sinirhodobacter populi]
MTNGGPWGSGGGQNGGKDDRDPNRRPGGRRPPEGPIPEIEDIMKKGSEHLRVLMGGRGTGGGRPSGGGGLPTGGFGKGTIALVVAGIVAAWGWASFYTVQQNERSLELMFGKYYKTGNPGLNFAPWPVITAEVLPVTDERTTELGTGRAGDSDSGLMLTRDQNIVDIEYQVVWNISDPAKYLFNLADPEDTIRAVSASAMRDIIARSELSPILNRDRGAIATDLRAAVQGTLDNYGVGINVVRVNFNRADPPSEVIDSFRDVQAAQQERDRLEKEADAYANQVTAGARGQAAQLQEQAEAYRAQTVNNAQGEAARFLSVYEEYVKAPDVTKRRMFFETMGRTLGDIDKVMIDNSQSEQGVVPYLPLDQLRRNGTVTAATGGNN